MSDLDINRLREEISKVESFTELEGFEGIKNMAMAEKMQKLFNHRSDIEACSFCQWQLESALEQSDDSRLAAYQMLAWLPMAVMNKSTNVDRETPDRVRSFYLFSVAWLVSRHKGKPKPWLKQQPYKSVEKYALLLEEKYNLLFGLTLYDGLFRRYFGLNPARGFIWWEYAICWRELHLDGLESKKKRYESRKEYLNLLGDTDPNLRNALANSPKRFSEFIEHFPSYIENEARKVAIENPDFHKNYYLPYLQREKTWNSHARKDKNIVAAI